MIRRERRDGGEGEERGLRKGAERREKRQKGAELQFEEEDKEHHTCLCFLFNFLKALSSRLDSVVKRCSNELWSILPARGLVKGLDSEVIDPPGEKWRIIRTIW